MDPSERSRIIRQGRKLEEEHEAHVKKAALMLDAQSRWKRTLNKQERRNREFILVALKSKKVPDQFKHWWGFDRTFSKELQHDRELFLERLELDSFASAFKNDVLKVPTVFRNDKEIMLKIVSKSSGSLVHASQELQNDRDVVMAAIQNKQPCAPMAIKHASKKLQGDKKIAHTLLGHGYGIKALKLLPEKLQHDYNLVLFAIQCSSDKCSESYEHLSELSEELLDDWDIVFEAVKRRGSNLRFVTNTSLLEDIDIIMAACENDGSAIQHVPKCPARDEMLEENNLIVLIENGGHCILNELGEEHMLQSKYLLAGVKNGFILPSDFTTKLYENDRPLFMNVLRHTNQPFKQYEEFPESICDDASVGTAILKTNEFDEGSWAFRFAKDVPEDVMRNHIKSLMKMAKIEYATLAASGEGLWNEKSIAVSLCKIDGDKFQCVSSRLRTDVDVVRAALSESISSYSILKVPETLLRGNHDIALQALQACCDKSPQWHQRRELFRHFGGSVTSSKPFVLAWIQKGWPTRNHYEYSFPFSIDSSFALEAITNAKDDYLGDIFTNLPSHHLRNKKIMVSAMQANPLAFRYASEDLLEDFDFMMRGVSFSKASLVHYSHDGSDFDRLASFAAEVRERLALADDIILHFFGAMSIDPSPSGGKRAKRRRTGRATDNRCHLRMLDLGGETGAFIKRKIAEYAGITVGPDLKLLRSALENLKFWGY